jgi:hypothetical protein
MGYKRQRKVFKLVFREGDLDGLVVHARSTSMRQFLEMQDMFTGLEAADGKTDSASLALQIKALFALFVGVLIDWNMEDEDTDEPLPTDLDTLLDLDFTVAMAIIEEWLKATAGVSEPVGKGSTPGVPLLEGSLQMEPLSPSLLNSSVPS